MTDSGANMLTPQIVSKTSHLDFISIVRIIQDTEKIIHENNPLISFSFHYIPIY